MKRIRLIAILVAMLIVAFASCRSSDPEPITSNTGPEQTYEPTALPTVEPTAEPTEEPTAAPTEAMLPIELDFNSCAEVIVSLIPGEEEEDVHYPGHDIDDDPPGIFYPLDDKLYIVNFDPDIAREYSTILAVDASGSVSLMQPEKNNASVSLYNIHANPFVIHGDLLIMHNKAYDMKNDRTIELVSPIPDVLEYASMQVMYAIGDDVFLSYDISEKADSRMVCRFDEEKTEWSEPELLFSAPEGSAYYSGAFSGADAEGNRYFTPYDPEAEKDGHFRRVLEKYGPDDRLLARMELPWFEEDLYGTGDSSFRVTEDGTVYIMAPFTDALKVYKINMG